MIKSIRTLSQQLVNPVFNNPVDLVTWMGAVQAQEYNMCKWAVGIRLQSATLADVNKALEKGEIIRTHILRPTWHLVSAKDIRWMLKLSRQRIKSALTSYGKGFEVTEELCNKAYSVIERILEGGKSMTKQELGEELSKAGITDDSTQLSLVISHAEIEGILCSGGDKNKKPTYALFEEQVPSAAELSKEEALARLATVYFRSHSPANIEDFTWWSGLNITEAKQAISLIQAELITDTFASQNLYLHQSWGGNIKCDKTFHFLPSYDEYLISYKDRSSVLDKAHYSKAFNTFGIFQPVIKYNGEVVGNWKKVKKGSKVTLEPTFFKANTRVNKKLMEKAEKRFVEFMQF